MSRTGVNTPGTRSPTCEGLLPPGLLRDRLRYLGTLFGTTARGIHIGGSGIIHPSDGTSPSPAGNAGVGSPCLCLL